MSGSIFIGLIQNIAVLLSFTLIYEYFWNKDEDIKNYPAKILTGIIIGLIGIFLMYMPWELTEGLVFDTRSVLLSVSGLFFGGIPTLIAMGITAAYRVYVGGSGMYMGVAVVLTSGCIGLVWRKYFSPRKMQRPALNLLLLGFVVHLTMLACTGLLPKEEIISTIRTIALPLLTIYTPGTMLLGLLMLKRLSIWQTRREKEESEKKYRDLVENAAEAIIVTQDAYIRYANGQAMDVLGYPEDKILSEPFHHFIHSDDRKQVMKRYTDRIDGKKVPKRSSFRIVTASGLEKWVELNAVLINWQGRPAVLNFFSDVTAYRETRRQLQIAKEKAEESDRLKSIFLANMSHEIRTPMNAIMGFSDLLLDDKLSEEKRKEFLYLIRSSGDRLTHIIDDILDLSKLETGTLSVHPVPFRLHDIFSRSIDVFRNSRLCKSKPDIRVELSFPEECREMTVVADPYRLQQVIDNLLDNAIKFSDKGIIELSCSIGRKTDRPELRVKVKDEGSGIPPDKQAIIFERFRQVEEDNFHEGAGLGLSISKGIVELMGGHISLTSEPGRGSCFSFNVPLGITDGVEEMDKKHDDSIPDLSGKYILISEDDSSSVFLLNEYLRDTKAEVAVAVDGEMLMRMLDLRLPDILLLDINMPKKDGYACLEEIREKGYNIKIIAQTAYAMQNDKEQCMRAGCHGYVSKPIDPSILFREIQKVLGQDR